MNIYVTQCYTEAGARFPFNHVFQRYMHKALSEATEMSRHYSDKYGSESDLTFWMDASTGLNAPLVKGPKAFKRTKDVEYFVSLPFIPGQAMTPNILRDAVTMLLECIVSVLNDLDVNTESLSKRAESIVSEVIAGGDKYLRI